MSRTTAKEDSAATYRFRFDAPWATRLFGEEHKVSGWLVDLSGEPIYGIRAIVRRPLYRETVVVARRKRSRPDIAAAFPDLPDALASGFLFELQLGLGPHYFTFQVRDHERVWRTFATATTVVFPFKLLRRLRLFRSYAVITGRLQQGYSETTAKAPHLGGDGLVAEITERTGDRINSPLPVHPNIPVSINHIDLFATTQSNLFILEIASLIAAGFREMGCTAELHLDGVPDLAPPCGTLQLVVTPHEYYNLFLSKHVSAEQARQLTRNVVLLCTEQPETGWFYSNLPWAFQARATADINPLGVVAYQNRNVASHHFSLGYHPMLSFGEVNTHARRRHDVTFLGAMTPRRDQFFAEYAPFFAQHRCHLRFVPLSFAKTKVTRSYLNSERRNELLNDSRILLNVHYSERQYLEWHRILIGLANGCCVISETSEGYGTLVPGGHFIMADREDLVACCEYYLNHPDECQAIAQRGLDFIQRELRQSSACQRFLQELQTTSSGPFPVTLDSNGAALPPALRRTLSSRRRKQLANALRTDVQTWFRRADKLSAGDFVTEHHRVSLMERRKAYQQRQSEQDERQSRGEPIWKLYDNSAYQDAKPGLSVIITLYNYAHFIDECMASVIQSANNLSDQVELVIVNDASTDNSLSRVRSLQAVSSFPMRVVDKTLNTGLADARNIGTALARAPYVFMMDADNLVFPDSLGSLLAAIQKDNQTAAYSLLCRFKGSTTNRVGLLSYYDWDPQILVQYPYIDAMAIFKRDVLLELGGYDNQLSQIGWFGWEDYDMWLRFAFKRYPVGFVPNILCLYRHHDTSMINATNLFEADLVRHFLARYRELVERFEPRDTLFGIAREKLG